MTEKKIIEEKPVCPSTKASSITLRRLAIRVEIMWLRARILALQARSRIKLLYKVLRLAPEATYISYKPLIPSKLLRELAEERGEDRDRFLERAWRYPHEVEEELGSTFEEIAIQRGYIATTTLTVERDYNSPSQLEVLRGGAVWRRKAGQELKKTEHREADKK